MVRSDAVAVVVVVGTKTAVHRKGEGKLIEDCKLQGLKKQGHVLVLVGVEELEESLAYLQIVLKGYPGARLSSIGVELPEGIAVQQYTEPGSFDTGRSSSPWSFSRGVCHAYALELPQWPQGPHGWQHTQHHARLLLPQ